VLFAPSRNYPAEDVKRLRPLPGLQSVSAAILNMLFTVHALGYGSCWMKGPIVAQEAFKNLAWVREGRFIAALLSVGEPDESPPARGRTPLDELMRTVG